MFVTRAHDVFTYVNRLWHEDCEDNDHNVSSIYIDRLVLLRHTPPVPRRHVFFATNRTRECIVDVKRKPVSLCVDPFRWIHSILADELRRLKARTMESELNVHLVSPFDVSTKAFIHRRVRKRVFIQLNGEIRRKCIVSDPIWRSYLRDMKTVKTRRIVTRE